MNASRELALQLRDVGVLRDGRWILQDLNWSVPVGSCAAILGPNGSGKSTLSRVLSGYLWPSCGKVTVAGQRFGQVDLNELRKSIRLVQAAGPFDVDPELSALDVVLTGLFGTIGLFDATTIAHRQSAIEWLSRVGMAHRTDQTYATMSSGERVRCLIARALISDPALLLLDEPTNGLDLLAREQVLAAIQAMFDRSSAHRKTTVLMITHHTEELPAAVSEVLLLDSGRGAATGPPPVVLRDEILSRVYGVPVQVGVEAGRYFVRPRGPVVLR